MTTDLTPSGIQRLLEICRADEVCPVAHDDMIIADYRFLDVARAALPDALREIENLTAMLNTQRAVNCSVSRGHSAIKGVNTKLSASISKVTEERDAAHTDIDTLMQINLDLVQEIDGLRAAIQAIIDRSNNREMGTGKVPDMREIAVKALADTSTGISIDPMSASRERIAALEAALKPFAESAENLDEDHADRNAIWETAAAMSIDAIDLRKARAVLSGGNEE